MGAKEDARRFSCDKILSAEGAVCMPSNEKRCYNVFTSTAYTVCGLTCIVARRSISPLTLFPHENEPVPRVSLKGLATAA